MTDFNVDKKDGDWFEREFVLQNKLKFFFFFFKLRGAKPFSRMLIFQNVFLNGDRECTFFALITIHI